MPLGNNELPDLLWMLMTTTQAQAPDNPAEVLDLVESDEETLAVDDAVSVSTGATPYTYNATASKWNLAQYS